VVKCRGVKTVLAFGETLWDLLPGGPVLGGAPCNFAFRVAELGDRALLATRLGTDELGIRAFEEIGSLGLDRSLVQRDEGRPTGTVPVTLDPAGKPEFTILPDTAYDRIEAAPGLLAAAAEADAVCFGTLVQRSAASRRTLRRVLDAAARAVLFLDVNLRRDCFSRVTVEESLERADVVKLNDGELDWLRGEFRLRGGTERALAREVARRWRLEAVVVTRGERGALAVAGRDEVEVAGRRVRVADTVGSGDAFSAGFLHGWLRGRALRDCAEAGNERGARVAATKGATAPLESVRA
jgi:fructokinase